MREKIVAMAIGNIAYGGRKEVVKRNEEMELVKGKKLTQLELEVAYAERYEGRADLFPERYPEMNGDIEEEKSKEFWGELWDVVSPMVKSDSPKWTEVNRRGVLRELRKLN